MAGRARRWFPPITRRWHVAAGAICAGNCPVVFVNIGGISNITFVPEKGDPVAFDTGPGNTLIDQWVATQRRGPV